jgi:transcriptional regulator with XRE-family HTH domain
MPSDDIKTLFGRRVRQLRTALGVAQEAFAHQIGIDRSYYGSIERGRRNVSLDNVQRIADGLGVPPADLFQFDALTETGAGPHSPAPKAKPVRKPDRHKPIA